MTVTVKQTANFLRISEDGIRNSSVHVSSYCYRQGEKPNVDFEILNGYLNTTRVLRL